MRHALGFIVAVLVLLGISSLVSAEGEPLKIGAMAMLGYFKPSDSAITDIYGGGGVQLGAELLLRASPQSEIGLGLTYFKKDGTPITIGEFEDASSQIKLTTFTAIYRYIFETKGDIEPYLGIGGGYWNVKETIEGTVEGYPVKGTADDTAFGFIIAGGFRAQASPNISIFAEARYGAASVEGQGGIGGAEVDVGGVSLLGGIVFHQ